jgi:hypothetical protein
MEGALVSNYIPIAVGFLLTTVAGGWWAARLQQRSWERQNDLRVREDEHQRAAAACEDISNLLDKRLYRMRRVYWAIQNYDAEPGATQRLDARLGDYNDVLYEWNDKLNLNLARIGSHFGPSAREWLYVLYEEFRRVGAELERAAQEVRLGANVSRQLEAIDPEFQGWHPASLNQRIYLLGLAMMTQLREELIGRNAPDKLPVPSLGRVDK